MGEAKRRPPRPPSATTVLNISLGGEPLFKWEGTEPRSNGFMKHCPRNAARDYSGSRRPSVPVANPPAGPLGQR